MRRVLKITAPLTALLLALASAGMTAMPLQARQGGAAEMTVSVGQNDDRGGRHGSDSNEDENEDENENADHDRGRGRDQSRHEHDDDEVKICHATGNGLHHTITIAPGAVSAHLAHGDRLGRCEGENHDADDDNDRRRGRGRDGDEDEEERRAARRDPVITNVNVATTTATTAIITWTTNEPSTSTVVFGPRHAPEHDEKNTVQNTALVTAHAVTLTGLQPDTTYRFRVESRDADGNKSKSDRMSFTTRTGTPDTTAPVITDVNAVNVTHRTAQIRWMTNEPSNSVVEYAPGPLTSTAVLTAKRSARVTTHIVTLSGLTASTTYQFRVSSADAAGNTATSTAMTFTTRASSDPAAPTISNLRATSTTQTSATVQWSTDIPATGKVTFAQQTLAGATTIWSIANTALVQLHSFLLNGLTAATRYFFVVESRDARGNTTTSIEQTFTTQP